MKVRAFCEFCRVDRNIYGRFGEVHCLCLQEKGVKSSVK